MKATTIKDNTVIFRESNKPEDLGYPLVDPKTIRLKKGSVRSKGSMPLESDMLLMQDEEVEMRDHVNIRADIYRPIEDGKYPAIIGWSPYGKNGGKLNTDVFRHPTRMDVPRDWEDGYNKFEACNPSYWVARGYVIVSPDPRGIGYSEGDMHAWGQQEAEDEYDLIEWIARQDWSNGKVGLAGNSWLAMSQWNVAALRPPHLTAIAPWEGALNNYKDGACRGGIPDWLFSRGIFEMICGTGKAEDVPAMTEKHQLYDEYWESKSPLVEAIDVPAYVVASWTNIVHTSGTIEGWRRMGSTEKWLRIHNTHEWTDFYKPDHVDELRMFFDHYLKGIANGWEQTARIRLATLNPGHKDEINRSETEFPLARQVNSRFYLKEGTGEGILSRSMGESETFVEYDSESGGCTKFCITFDAPVEVTGYAKLKLWVEAPDSDDLDLFALVRKLDINGLEQQSEVVKTSYHPGPNGRLRVSLRETDPMKSTENEPFHNFRNPKKLSLGEIVPIEIGFWPHSMRWEEGETLVLEISGTEQTKRPEFPNIPPVGTINKGRHKIHFGGCYDSHIVLPIDPGKKR